ncbi:ATP-binding cassette domain-containing protein, partial [Klebsiella pneumoniae]
AASRRQSPGEARATAEETLQRIGLSELRTRLVGDLAHGQRQWVELGMILASRPELVLLDEPAAGMTYQEVRKTAALIKEINAHS